MAENGELVQHLVSTLERASMHTVLIGRENQMLHAQLEQKKKKKNVNDGVKTDARILTGHEGVAIILADVEEKARNAVADAEVRRRAELEKIGKAIDKMVTKWEAECKRERAESNGL